jgi:hypothetical protein
MVQLKTEKLIPRPAAAREFGVTCRTMSRWEALHGLTPFKVTSRLVCYPASQIEKLKANARAAGASESETIPTATPAQPCSSRSKRTSRK